MASFRQLGVSNELVKGIAELGIKTPTQIQEQAIPFLIQVGADFVGQAQTGTGKTAAFGLPVLHRINVNQQQVQAVILAPTRELGQQIAKQLFKYTKYLEDKIFIELACGGMPIGEQIKRLKRPTHVVVATPGRLVELIQKQIVDLKNIRTVALDEADEMLSMGFKDDLDYILSHTPRSKKTWLFSATIPQGVQQIISNYLSENAKKVQIDKKFAVNKGIKHLYLEATLEEKVETLIEFLETKDNQRGIVFCRTKVGVQKLAEDLKEEHFSVEALHGDLTQKERDKVMRAFKNDSLQFLVTTDLVARGIDVQGLEFVIHFQLPEKTEFYTHRSGRTARGGKTGLSLAIITPDDKKHLNKIASNLDIEITPYKM